MKIPKLLGSPRRRKSDPEKGDLTISDAFYALRFLWWIGGLVLITFGLDFKTPASHFREVEDRMTAVEKQHASIERYLHVLTLSQCMNRPAREAKLMELPCDSLLQSTRMDRINALH